MMNTESIFKIAFFLFSLLLLVGNRSCAQPLGTVCFNSTSTYKDNSTFQHNLNALLSSLGSNVTFSFGFYNTTTGRHANRVYGLALCRGDVSSAACEKCTTDAASKIVQGCENGKSAIIWFDDCLLRYSNTNFFGTIDAMNVFLMVNVNNVSNQALFNQSLVPLMRDLTSMATSSESAHMFAAGSVKYNETETIYGLVQCTRDLSMSNCKKCLEASFGAIPIKQGARVVGSSCNLRYETYPFFHTQQASPAPSPASQPLPPQLSPAAPLPPLVSPPFPLQSVPPAAPAAPAEQPKSSGNRSGSFGTQLSMTWLLFLLISVVVGFL